MSEFKLGDRAIYRGRTYSFPGDVSAVTTDGQVVLSALGDLATGHYARMKHIFAPNQLEYYNSEPWVPTHLHVKSGGLYRVLHIGRTEWDAVEAVIYQSHKGDVWVRPRAQFEDGRFQKL